MYLKVKLLKLNQLFWEKSTDLYLKGWRSFGYKFGHIISWHTYMHTHLYVQIYIYINIYWHKIIARFDHWLPAKKLCIVIAIVAVVTVNAIVIIVPLIVVIILLLLLLFFPVSYVWVHDIFHWLLLAQIWGLKAAINWSWASREILLCLHAYVHMYVCMRDVSMCEGILRKK